MKASELALADRPRGELEGLEPDAVARRLVVEAEGAVARRVVADLGQAAVDSRHQRSDCVREGRCVAQAGQRRVAGAAGQRMLDVGEDQLLVLLLVLQAERRAASASSASSPRAASSAAMRSSTCAR